MYCATAFVYFKRTIWPHSTNPLSGSIETTLKDPLKEALKEYNDKPGANDEAAKAYKNVWNQVQDEVSLIQSLIWVFLVLLKQSV